jgi:predicted enzyme related to lactoylglutathione lyase
MMPMQGDDLPPEIPNHWLVYFAVADVDQTCAKLTELGGTVAVSPMETPAGKIAVVMDPHGSGFAVITLPPQ